LKKGIKIQDITDDALTGRSKKIEDTEEALVSKIEKL